MLITLVVGLGNPGNQNTRHNIGFMVLDALAMAYSVGFQKKNALQAWIASVSLSSTDILLLLKPATYMNLSGSAVLKALSFYRLKSENVIVVMDDLDLPFGTVRTRLQGSSGGHKGLVSIQEALDTAVYRRVRLGVGNTGLEKVRVCGTVSDFVLSHFDQEETEKLGKYCQLGVEAVLALVASPQSKTRVLES
jgi:PTH1 family peptidyl-tRNA hydrolase